MAIQDRHNHMELAFMEALRQDFLQRPIYVRRNDETGLYVAWDDENPTLSAYGENQEEALRNLIRNYLEAHFA